LLDVFGQIAPFWEIIKKNIKERPWTENGPPVTHAVVLIGKKLINVTGKHNSYMLRVYKQTIIRP
jgi:hypothetical protein